MKKLRFYYLIILIAMISCHREEEFESMDSTDGLYARMEGMQATRTSVDESNNIVWSEGDQISVFNKSTAAAKYQIQDESVGKTSGKFFLAGPEAAGETLKHIIAYYPYLEEIKCKETEGRYELTGISLPAEQIYAVESFSQGYFPMIAVSEDQNITFKNICGGLKLLLKGNQAVTSIKVAGKNKERLSGAAVITAYSDGTVPVITMDDNSAFSVELVCPDAVQLNEATAAEFIITLPPTEFSKGFTVTITDIDNQTYTIDTGKKNTILRSSLLVMPEIVLNPAVGFNVWDGKTPKESPLTMDPADSETYIIDEAADIAWLGVKANAQAIGENKTLVFAANIDMAKMSMKHLQLPAGTTIEGNGHTIKGIKLTSAIFYNATELTVNDLIIDNADVAYEGTSKSHRGILVNTLSGSSSFRNVTVINSKVSTAVGNAGGFVGYIQRKEKSNRDEKLDVMFDNCHVINTTVSAESKEGYFVGMFRGYDNGETLAFKDNCSVSPIVGKEPLKSYIKDENKAVWLADKDFTRYDKWLGAEECYRGMVYLGSERFISKWDGETTVTPLLADPTYDNSDQHTVEAGTRRYMIYSPFDLAGARKASASPIALYFKVDVDMNGQGKDGVYYVPEEFSNGKCASEDDNSFKPFSTINHLDGQNNTIYNLSLNSRMISESTYTSAFVRSVNSSSITVHKNLIFRNCCSIAPVYTQTSYKQDLSGGAIMIYNTGPSSTGEPTYTMDNIHVYDSKVFALQHSGILIGLLSRGNVSNCSVNNSYIENYKCQNTLEQFVETVNIVENEITISAGFYSYGEIGGLIGMVRRTSNVSDCHVRGCTIHAFGNNDKEADMASDGFWGKAAIAAAKGMGFYIVPGRHVSTLIGDIRTHNGEKITISNCTVDAATKCTAEQHQHNSSFPYIGQAYYIQFDDTIGEVTVNGTKLTLADGNKNTKR